MLEIVFTIVAAVKENFEQVRKHFKVFIYSFNNIVDADK